MRCESNIFGLKTSIGIGRGGESIPAVGLNDPGCLSALFYYMVNVITLRVPY